MIDLIRRAPAAALAAAMLSAPGLAGPAGDQLFVGGVFAGVPIGSELVYSHLREGAASDALRPIPDGVLRLTLRSGADGGTEAVVRMKANGRERELHPLPVSAGNPLLTTFLESSLRAMARITGGSPFYIRNRMKEAFRTGGEVGPITVERDGRIVAAKEIIFRPFADDPAKARMGPFADLTLRFVMADSAPGGFLSLSATSGDAPGGGAAFHEEIALQAPGGN